MQLRPASAGACRPHVYGHSIRADESGGISEPDRIPYRDTVGHVLPDADIYEHAHRNAHRDGHGNAHTHIYAHADRHALAHAYMGPHT